MQTVCSFFLFFFFIHLLLGISLGLQVSDDFLIYPALSISQADDNFGQY